MKSKYDLTSEKYLNILKELREILKFTDKLSLRSYLESKGSGSRCQAEIMKGGIVKNIGGKAKTARYVWNTIEPNIKMAKELQYRVNNAYRKEEVKILKKSSDLKSNRINREVSYYKTLLFWGLLKVKTKVFYKDANNQ